MYNVHTCIVSSRSLIPAQKYEGAPPHIKPCPPLPHYRRAFIPPSKPPQGLNRRQHSFHVTDRTIVQYRLLIWMVGVWMSRELELSLLAFIDRKEIWGINTRRVTCVGRWLGLHGVKSWQSRQQQLGTRLWLVLDFILISMQSCLHYIAVLWLRR